MDVVSGKYLGPWCSIPGEPVTILLHQLSCATHLKHILVVPASHKREEEEWERREEKGEKRREREMWNQR